MRVLTPPVSSSCGRWLCCLVQGMAHYTRCDRLGSARLHPGCSPLIAGSTMAAPATARGMGHRCWLVLLQQPALPAKFKHPLGAERGQHLEQALLPLAFDFHQPES